MKKKTEIVWPFAKIVVHPPLAKVWLVLFFPSQSFLYEKIAKGKTISVFMKASLILSLLLCIETIKKIVGCGRAGGGRLFK